MRYLIFDVSNMLHKTFYAYNTDDDITIAGMASQTALVTLNKYYKKYRPDKIIMAFDRPSWRISYTKSDECLSGLVYKGERRKDQTESQKERYKLFKQHVADFEELIRENTSIISLARTNLEADDMIASIKTQKLLQGVRGEKPSDIAKLSECIQRLSQLVSDFKEIKELDMNPVLVMEKGNGCRILDVRIGL